MEVYENLINVRTYVHMYTYSNRYVCTHSTYGHTNCTNCMLSSNNTVHVLHCSTVYTLLSETYGSTVPTLIQGSVVQCWHTAEQADSVH